LCLAFGPCCGVVDGQQLSLETCSTEGQHTVSGLL